MNTEQLLQFAQIGVSMLAFGGIIFGLGRLTERVAGIERSQLELKQALFGGDDQEGAFLRRAEAKLMLENATREHEAFDRRLTELTAKVGRMEKR